MNRYGVLSRLSVLLCSLYIALASAKGDDAALPISVTTQEDSNWGQIEALGRQGQYDAVLELVKGDGASLHELLPNNARRFLLLGIAGVRSVRVSIFEALRAGLPIPSDLELKLKVAETRLNSAKVLLRSNADSSLGSGPSLVLVRESIDAYLLAIENIHSEQAILNKPATVLNPEGVALYVRDGLRAGGSLSKAIQEQILDINEARQAALHNDDTVIGDLATKVARAGSGLDLLRNAISEAEGNVKKALGDSSSAALKLGLKQSADSDAGNVFRELESNTFSFCEPEVDKPPDVSAGYYSAFRYLCGQKSATDAARQNASAFVAFATDQASLGKPKAAVKSVIDLLLTDQFRDDLLAPKLTAIGEKLDKKP